jgi:hypothetical protein
MAVTRAPKRNAVQVEENRAELDDVRIKEIIDRGGSVFGDRHKESYEDEQKNVQLRLYQSMIAEIDEHRKRVKRGKKPSRHSWIVDAIAEKLDRER